jgi:protocatechuate 3,4-dioxygenase beta subunit
MLTRRRIIAAAALMPIFPAWAQKCGPATPPQTEGPFFKTSTPQRIALIEPASKAPRLALTGQVLGRDCKPVKGALLDFWHADEAGEYDNRGFRYRGHQFTDAEGRYRLETIVPAEYPGRARHIHVKVQAPGGRVLTTQLYFPDQSGNRRDGLFRPELVMQMKDRSQGAFDFVVAA